MLRHLTIKFQLTLLIFLCVSKSYSQTVARSYHKVVVEITKEKKPKKVYSKVEITPAFLGGDSTWIQSLEDSLNRSIPIKNGAKPGKYIVSVRFLIEKDGSMSDIVCLNDAGFGMCKLVMAAIKKKIHWGAYNNRPPNQLK